MPGSNLATTCGPRLLPDSSGGAGLLKISPTGVCRWMRKIVSGGVAQTLALDQRGHLFLSGDFFDSVRIGNTVLRNNLTGGGYYYLARFDTAGTAQWATRVGSGGGASGGSGTPPFNNAPRLQRGDNYLCQGE